MENKQLERKLCPRCNQEKFQYEMASRRIYCKKCVNDMLKEKKPKNVDPSKYSFGKF